MGGEREPERVFIHLGALGHGECPRPPLADWIRDLQHGVLECFPDHDISSR